MEKSIPTHKRAILGKTCTERKLSENLRMKISEIVKDVRVSQGHEAAEQIAEELTDIIGSCATEEELTEAIEKKADEAEYALYREALIGLVCSINREIPLEEKNQVLIVYKLNTPAKIIAFNEWVKSRLSGEKLEATEAEIVRAAVQAGKGEIL